MCCLQIEISAVKANVGKRVKIYGWVHALRSQGSLIFINLRDGTGVPAILQCVLAGKLSQTYEALSLHREAAVCIYGTVKEDEVSHAGQPPPSPLSNHPPSPSHLPPSLSTAQRAPGGVELPADYWQLVGQSDGDIENRINKDSNVEQLADQRHLVIRQLDSVYILRLRSIIIQCFREHFFDKDFVEVTPPTLVQTQVEGGSTLFSFDYFGEPAFLTQSSQLYLETAIPAMGKVFCCLPSFRAEKSRTRRHLAEFTHFEGEAAFISYEDLLDLLEDMCVDVAARLVKRAGPLLKEVNPNFVPPTKPFLRMNYSDAVEYCRKNSIYKDEEAKEHFVFGDDIPEGPERKMTDMIGRPILLCRFPAHMKSFYMAKCPEDEQLTESVDLLMPGVGEIIGGSMRLYDMEKLMEGYKREGIDPHPYYWYNDLRRFGTCPHGGWGLGIERYLCWILNRKHIRDVTLYPRHIGRCKP